MNLIQAFVGVVFLMAFATLAFLALWYIAVPVLLIGLIIWMINGIRLQWGAYQAERAANGCRIRPVEHKQRARKQSEVIDVDYREVP